ncbi:MAG TPA: glycosyltransferase family A protein [Acidimicrobiales bacterium]
MSGALVSVVMPAFDEESFIAEALRSVLAQTYRPVEIIVVDDGSSDRTAEIATEHAVRVCRRPHGGPAAARNAGLAVARGAYWAIFDADDVMPPQRLSHQVAYLDEHPEAGMVLGLAEAFVTPGEPRPAHFNPVWGDGPYRGHWGTMLARRSVLDVVGPFNDALALGEDVEWMARANDAGVHPGQLDQVCLRYRIHRGQTSSDPRANRLATLKVLRASVHRRRQGAADE